MQTCSTFQCTMVEERCGLSLTQCFEYLFHALQTVGNNLREEEEGRMGRREQEEECGTGGGGGPQYDWTKICNIRCARQNMKSLHCDCAKPADHGVEMQGDHMKCQNDPHCSMTDQLLLDAAIISYYEVQLP